jgi:hypothetical protein
MSIFLLQFHRTGLALSSAQAICHLISALFPAMTRWRWCGGQLYAP